MRILVSIVLAVGMMFLGGSSSRAPAQAKDNEPKKSTALVDGKTLYEWQKELRHADASVKARAIATIKVYGREARESAKDVIDALGAQDVSVRVNAAITLGFIGADGQDRQLAVNALIRSLSDPQGIVRFQAAKALERLGTSGIDVSAAAPALLQGVRNTSTFEIRAAAAGALGRAGFDAQKGPNTNVLAELVKTLDSDRCLEVRLEAIRALILLGRPIQVNDLKAEEQALLRLSGNKRAKKEQIWSRVALLRLAQKIEGDKTSEKYLTDIAHFLKSAEYQARLDAAHAFATIGREGKSHLNDLIEALDDKEPAVLLYVCLALGEMHDAAEKAVPHLKRLQEQDSNEAVKAAAKEAITKISEKVKVEEKPPPKKAP